jgi:hypothetical protein
MINTTITVTETFPMTPGEVIRIKNSNGKGIWREYTVGKKSGEDKDAKTVTYRAKMSGSVL